jgi:hypothetical protein
MVVIRRRTNAAPSVLSEGGAVDIGLVSDFIAQTSTGSEPSGSAPSLSQVIGGWIVSIIIAVVGVYASRNNTRASSSTSRDPLDERLAELAIFEKERDLGLDHKDIDRERIGPITAESILKRGTAQEILLRFVLLYLILQVWGIVGDLFNVSSVGFGYLITIVPQVIRALIVVIIGWPLLLDTATLLNIQLPGLLYKSWVRWLLIIIAILAEGSRSFF